MNGKKRYRTSLVWLRRDLRLNDNVALYDACMNSDGVAIAFVLNPPLLQEDRMGAPLVQAFLDALASLRNDLRSAGSDLLLTQGAFAEEICRLAQALGAQALFFNDDYEPEAVERDDAVSAAVERLGLSVHRSVDHVYFGADEVVRADTEPYRIFTPYKRSWLERRAVSPRAILPSYESLAGRLIEVESLPASAEIPAPRDFGFEPFSLPINVSERAALDLLTDFLEQRADRYEHDRDIPALAGTSGLSVHLRAGTVGIRTCVERAFARRNRSLGHARASLDAWISELIWRDFYQMIYRRFPHVATHPFQPEAECIKWNEPGASFVAWCAGRTGYPIVDAGMRQLNTQGWMHNRLRMIVASFLSKHLLVDWRSGARYFEQHLVDADPAQNNGGWQWAASTGTDAAPYFRIFNPIVQGKRFDGNGVFVKRFIPELSPVPERFIHEPWKMPYALQERLNVVIGRDYPAPIVDHATARDRARLALNYRRQ